MTETELLPPEADDDYPFEVHDLPSGGRVFYRDSDHSYWRDVKRKRDGWSGTGRLLGVSTVAGTFDRMSDGLMDWACRLDRQGVAEIASLGMGCEDPGEILMALDFLRSGESIGEALVESEATWRHVRDRAGTRGTNVHLHALHALATGRPTPDVDMMTEEEQGYARGVAKWWLDVLPKPLLSETVVADLDLGVAGRFDLVAVIRGEHVLVDAKTGNYLSAPAAVQQAGYLRLIEASGYPRPDRAMLLKLSADGSYLSVPVNAQDRDFELAVELYERRKVIDGEMRKAVRGE